MSSSTNRLQVDIEAGPNSIDGSDLNRVTQQSGSTPSSLAQIRSPASHSPHTSPSDCVQSGHGLQGTHLAALWGEHDPEELKAFYGSGDSTPFSWPFLKSAEKWHAFSTPFRLMLHDLEEAAKTAYLKRWELTLDVLRVHSKFDHRYSIRHEVLHTDDSKKMEQFLQHLVANDDEPVVVIVRTLTPQVIDGLGAAVVAKSRSFETGPESATEIRKFFLTHIRGMGQELRITDRIMFGKLQTPTDKPWRGRSFRQYFKLVLDPQTASIDPLDGRENDIAERHLTLLDISNPQSSHRKLQGWLPASHLKLATNAFKVICLLDNHAFGDVEPDPLPGHMQVFQRILMDSCNHQFEAKDAFLSLLSGLELPHQERLLESSMTAYANYTRSHQIILDQESRVLEEERAKPDVKLVQLKVWHTMIEQRKGLVQLLLQRFDQLDDTRKAIVCPGRTRQDFVQLLEALQSFHLQIRQDQQDAISDVQLSLTRLQIEESRTSIEQNNQVRKLTILAFIFIPFSAVCSAFGMNIAEIQTSPPAGWKFAVTVVLVVGLSVVLASWSSLLNLAVGIYVSSSAGQRIPRKARYNVSWLLELPFTWIVWTIASLRGHSKRLARRGRTRISNVLDD